MVDFVNRSETPDELHNARINFCARYLDMPISWVHPFSVTNAGWHRIDPKKPFCFLMFTLFPLYGRQNMMDGIRMAVKRFTTSELFWNCFRPTWTMMVSLNGWPCTTTWVIRKKFAVGNGIKIAMIHWKQSKKTLKLIKLSKIMRTDEVIHWNVITNQFHKAKSKVFLVHLILVLCLSHLQL